MRSLQPPSSLSKLLLELEKPTPSATHYTSRGPLPSYHGVLKHDIMALGYRVHAAFVPHRSVTNLAQNVFLILPCNYNLISGTFIAFPHAFGITSLLKVAHPSQFDSPFATGASEIDFNKALNSGTL
ncbi:Peptidase S8/S53 domain superfamily [Sesbania bispinosa]|nr:Peptidase S8/S53 domain superfamily [Sesbania bispinosa]